MIPMTAAKKMTLLSVDDYLAGELVSPIKHEYLGGAVYAMAGAGFPHNTIATNALVALGVRLRGKRCQALNSDTKVRVQLAHQTRFYYPDAQVVCPPNVRRDSFQDAPRVIVEVLSRGTRRIDEGEKKDAYLTIPTLSVYLLVEQESPTVVAYRRTATGMEREVYQGLDGLIPLPEIEAELPLAELYDRIDFAPEPEDEPA